MDSNAAMNEMKVVVLSDLAAICKKLAENSAVPDEMRVHARELVREFELLLPDRGKGTPFEHFLAEKLMNKMALFLERIAKVQSRPANASNL
jgi:hypothetical protein